MSCGDARAIYPLEYLSLSTVQSRVGSRAIYHLDDLFLSPMLFRRGSRASSLLDGLVLSPVQFRGDSRASYPASYKCLTQRAGSYDYQS